MPLLDKLREQVRGRTGMQRTAYSPRQRITIVSNSDIIRINAVPVRSTTTG